MRDPNRLYGFYNELMKVHMEIFPDLRFGQLFYSLERWLQINKNIEDVFYVEEDTMLKYINEFAESMKGNK